MTINQKTHVINQKFADKLELGQRPANTTPKFIGTEK